MSMIFVIGATGKVGRHVVSGLLERDASVRALARDPDAAGLPGGIDVVAGDLSDPPGLAPHLDGVDAVFLVWPFFSADGAFVETPEVVTTTVAETTGEPARPFAEWARDHVEEFR
jgi:uncharacterized protein YbjT (DUF2867 family)